MTNNVERLQVIFSAVAEINKDIGPYNSDTTVVFNKVITNIGGAYKEATGVFVAPVAGVYNFTFFYHSGSRHETNLALLKNGNVIVKSHDHNTGPGHLTNNGGNTVFIELQKLDQVYVKLMSGHYIWGGEKTTTFSGFLVCQM